MEDCINERLKLLAAAQESMIKIADFMEQWEKSQTALEKCTFDSMNISDEALNLSREGNRLILKLTDSFNLIPDHSGNKDAQAMISVLKDACNMFRSILEATRTASEIAHNLEQEVANQREIAEHMKDNVNVIEKNVNQTVACAEFLFADL
jgi:hypothetical protein